MTEPGSGGDSRAESIFDGDLPLERKLDRARNELLDLTARNRLLNMPRSSRSARVVEMVDEKSTEIFRMLVDEGRAFTFLPGRDPAPATPDTSEEKPADTDDEIADLAQPDDDSTDERGVLKRHTDTRLQTRLTSKGLQKRLLDMYFDARLLEEEQGVNILFLALGALKWIDPNNAANVRHAPLILIPVNLERVTAGERFKLAGRAEDPTTNLSLEVFLDRVHTVKIPSVEPNDEFDLPAYFAAVGEAIRGKPGWDVLPDHVVLGFFSFSKFLMYRDLAPEAWPADAGLLAHPLIRGLMRDGFGHVPPALADDSFIDAHLAPADMLHILDSDSSQTLAVHDVRSGRNLVIQGPPGTGKSQTIANVIASAVADGKSVLFVAEKMAALDVVKRRLDRAGVGDACLELHSNKANKRAVVDELKRTWQLGAPSGAAPDALLRRLQDARDTLNGHVDRMHRAHAQAGLTPYQVIGHLVRLRQAGQAPVDLRLPTATQWTAPEFRQRADLLVELAERVADIGTPARHVWRGVHLSTILPNDLQRLTTRIAALQERYDEAGAVHAAVAARVLQAEPACFADFSAAAELARRLGTAPDLDAAALASPAWDEHGARIEALLAAGREHARHVAALRGKVQPSGWTMAVGRVRDCLAALPPEFDREAFARVGVVQTRVPALVAETARLAAALGLESSTDTLAAIARIATTGKRVGDAPNVSPNVFAATVWEYGVEQANDLAEAAATLEHARKSLDASLIDAAWDVDLRAARQTLAAHGTSWLRHLSSDWRRSDRSVRSLLRSPTAPLPDVLDGLDALAKGQAALAQLRAGDGFGRAAFGADWRGEKSSAAPLRALVAWMRSLEGLGAEPRLIASRLPDRTAVGLQAQRVESLLADVQSTVQQIWNALGATVAATFGDALDPSTAALPALVTRIGMLGKADAICRAILTDDPPVLADRLALLDALHAAQTAAAAIAEGDDLGSAAFAGAWKGADTDWEFAHKSALWININSDIRALAARVSDRAQVAMLAGQASRDLDALKADSEQLLASLDAGWAGVFDGRPFERLSARDVAARLGLWQTHAEQLSKWVAYGERARRARALGLEAAVDELADGRLAPDAAIATFEMAYYETLFADQVRTDPELARFDGELQARRVAEFVALDRERIAGASIEVARAHHQGVPAPIGLGAIGVLRAEMARRRGLMPIRQLMQKAAPAIQALKPVMMMSPLSVAQFLPPGRLSFDLLVMDEASQIQPVDAVGAIARCRQVVVVGDERQLPPTRFFSRMTGADGEQDDDDGAQVADIESILGLFTARGLPQRMLRWHYRSRHQSLIAVSNSQFYDNKLVIIPSPHMRDAGMGLSFHPIAGGVFDTGNSGTNIVEAKAVAEAIVRHARTDPQHSLGVATFSVRQRRAIVDQLEILRRLNPDTEAFFNGHPSEPFFVKNLENVQGDERDVIFISVGYGRNAQGNLAMRFGPLGAEGGERRLNVVISRAKRRCEVFASITDEDIDLERARGKGVLAFKLFLHYARTGRLSLAHGAERTDETLFEAEVAKALQARGYQVHPRVGVSGCFIDLAVADPQRPGRYVLGIDCDGPSYRSARSARDRDRLRRSVLEDHGWIMHRLWSFDWFQRPQEQLARTVAAIEAAKAELRQREEGAAARQRAVPVEIVTVEREHMVEIGLEVADAAPKRSQAYVETGGIRPLRGVELHDAPADVLAGLVEKVVATEGPIHLDEVVTRIRSGWGLKRSGHRIQSAVERGVLLAIRNGKVVDSEGFLSGPQTTPVVRDRSNVESPGLRRAEMLPPAEIDRAITSLVQASLGARRAEIVAAACRALGFATVSAPLRELVQTRIDRLVAAGLLGADGETLRGIEAGPGTG